MPPSMKKLISFNDDELDLVHLSMLGPGYLAEYKPDKGEVHDENDLDAIIASQFFDAPETEQHYISQNTQNIYSMIESVSLDKYDSEDSKYLIDEQLTEYTNIQDWFGEIIVYHLIKADVLKKNLKLAETIKECFEMSDLEIAEKSEKYEYIAKLKEYGWICPEFGKRVLKDDNLTAHELKSINPLTLRETSLRLDVNKKITDQIWEFYTIDECLEGINWKVNEIKRPLPLSYAYNLNH